MDKEERYIVDHSVPQTPALEWIRRQTNLRTNRARMLSGPVQGALLTLLVQSCGVRRALEIGTFTGYASTCIAMGLPAGHDPGASAPGMPSGAGSEALPAGHLDSLEINDELVDLIHEGWERAGVADRITLHVAPALQTLADMAQKLSEGTLEPYDFAYIDANKREYTAYYEAVLPLMRPGGLILADNTLWDGKILEDPMPVDAQTVEIARFNDHVAADPRVSVVLLPLRDGLSLIRKK